MKSLKGEISKLSVSTKLLAVIIIILFLVSAVLVSNIAISNRVKDTIVTMVEGDVNQIVNNMDALKELNQIFSQVQQLLTSFPGNETNIAINKEPILHQLEKHSTVFNNVNNVLVKSIANYTNHLELVFSHSQLLGAILNDIINIENKIENNLYELDHLVLEHELLFTPKKEWEMEFFKQLSIALPAYHEIYNEIKINLLHLQNVISQSGNPVNIFQRKIFSLLDEFDMGLQSTTTATKNITSVFTSLIKLDSDLGIKVSDLFKATAKYRELKQENQILQNTVLAEIDQFNQKISLQSVNLGASASVAISKAIRVSILLSALIIVLLLIIAFVSVKVVRPLKKLNFGMKKVSSGNLEFKIDVNTQDEFGQLAGSFNQMTEDLKQNTVSRIYVENILKSMDESLIVLDSNNLIRMVNPATCQILGYQAKELIGQPFEQITGIDQKIILRRGKLDNHGNTFHSKYKKTEGTYLTKDGTQIPIILSTATLPDRNNGMDRIVCVATDISDRKRSELALSAEKERLSVTLRSIGDGVICTDVHGKVTLLNVVAEKLTGYSQNEAIDKPLEEIFHIIHEITRKPCDNPVTKVIQHGTTIGLANHTLLVSKDGEEYIIADSAAPILDQNNHIVGVVLVFRDITEKQKMEAELLKVQKLESMGILAGGIAHDFNNYLTAIIGNLSLAKMDAKSGDPALSWLDEMEKASVQAKNLTQQLLTFSKGGEPVKKLVDLRPLLENSVSFSLRGSNVQPNLIIAEELPMVELDEGQFSQVIHNLILNADQAMPDGGILNINAEDVNLGIGNEFSLQVGRYVHLSFEDQGPGIQPDHVLKIFDPYFTTKSKGSGLGLAAAYSIIDKHDGRLSVESQIDSGATFHIYLPASEKPVPAKVDTETQLIAGKGRVLVMDDEHFIRDIARIMISKLGYEVTVTKDGKETVATYQEAKNAGVPFDIVVLDLTIPGGMGGKETIQLLKKIDPDVKAVVSSGYSNDPIMGHFKEYGFSGIVSKPYLIQEMSDVLHQVMLG